MLDLLDYLFRRVKTGFASLAEIEVEFGKLSLYMFVSWLIRWEMVKIQI